MSKTTTNFPIIAGITAFLGGLALLVVLYKHPSIRSRILPPKVRHQAQKYGTDNYPCVGDSLLVGIDVSHHQAHIHWGEVLEQHPEVQFAYLRVSYGNSKVDARYARNVRATNETRLKTGAYHYYRPNTPSAKQFAFFHAHYQPDAHEMPVVLDIEELGKHGVENLRAGLKNWLELAEKAYGHRPMIYTGISFYDKYLKGYFDDYPLWLAGYDRCPTQERWHIHQYSDKGRLHGIQGAVDLNRMKGWPEMVHP